MGLADRDYMRDRHKETGHTKRRFRGTYRDDAWPHWKVALVVVGACALIFLLSKWALESKSYVPFPATGDVRWYVQPPEADGAPLTISAPGDDKRDFVVQLNDAGSDRIVAIIPVRSGEAAQLQVPLGRYKIKIASGKNWQGPEKLFGMGGEVRNAVEPLDFYRNANQTSGHRIDLRRASR